jgi:type II secretory pathway component GspD/PulD (secretin)
LAAGWLAPALIAEAGAAPDNDAPAAAAPANGLVFNFQDVPLGAVLNYLSAKAGLIIVSEADVKGAVSVVAKQPVTTNEIVDLLNERLARNNCAAVLNGRTLTIMEASRARTSASTPVLVNNSGPNEIPISDRIVTEILPLQTLQAAQLVKDLASLVPAGAGVTANEAGNAIIMTASQKDVRRISEIIAALDSSSVSEIKVFALKFGDAKSVAAELKEIFHSADSEGARAGSRNNFQGPGGPGGPFGPGGPGGDGGGNTRENSATKAVFASDDQMNAVVASAPSTYMPIVSKVIEQLDAPIEDITQIKVFKLKHADPTEIVDKISNLFPSSNSGSDDSSRSMGFQFNPFGGSSSGNSGQSDRRKRKTAVQAVADRRTESVVVTASKDLMVAIMGIIAALDEGNQGMTHVVAIPLASADPASVQLTLTGLYQNQGSSSSSQSSTALSARAQANNNSQSSSTTTSTSGSGTGSGSSGGSAGR